MVPQSRQQISSELEFIHRFAAAYSQRFQALIDGLNSPTIPSAGECLRLCVETVNLLLSTQQQIAGILQQMAVSGSQRRAA